MQRRLQYLASLQSAQHSNEQNDSPSLTAGDLVVNHHNHLPIQQIVCKFSMDESTLTKFVTIEAKTLTTVFWIRPILSEHLSLWMSAFATLIVRKAYLHLLGY